MWAHCGTRLGAGTGRAGWNPIVGVRSVFLTAAVLLTTGSVAAVMIPAHAADLGRQRVTPGHEVVRWSGSDTSIGIEGNSSPLEQTCTATTCDVIQLDVEMPAGSFPAAGDGLLVSVKWANDLDQWNLYVDGPDGRPVARGIDIFSNAQSVLVPQPLNGIYTVHVVPFQTMRPVDLSYTGEARAYVDPEVRAASGTPLLPRLETVPPYDFHIGDVPPAPSNPTGWRWTPDGTFSTSCYLDELASATRGRCLRFSNDIRNVGGGPLLMRFRYDQGVATHCVMEQEIKVAAAPPIDRNGGPCVFHAQHAHFHYQNMAQYVLFAVGAEGHPGAAPVARSGKVGYCLADVDDQSFGGAQTRPRTYIVPTACVPNTMRASHPPVWDYMGISAGWGDIYTWDLPGQYIDISHLGDGVYEVVSRANLDRAILESEPGLETGITCIRIAGDRVSVVREFPSQSNDAPLPECPAAARLAG